MVKVILLTLLSSNLSTDAYQYLMLILDYFHVQFILEKKVQRTHIHITKPLGNDLKNGGDDLTYRSLVPSGKIYIVLVAKRSKGLHADY